MNTEILSRLVRLETKVCLKFEEWDKNIILARQNTEKERKEAKEALDVRLASMNEFQRRMDRLEGTFATKEALARVEKLVYIGFGIVIALEMVLRVLK